MDEFEHKNSFDEPSLDGSIAVASRDSNSLVDALEENELASDTYTYRLDLFEGPLDLLLELVKKSKLSIEEIEISKITEQYMAYMADVGAMDLDRASEFIGMAAWLLEIKSKSLLPKIVEEYIEEEDGERLLIRKLEEYKLYKEASAKMRKIETVDILFREPDSSFIEKPRFEIKDMNKDCLMDALKKMFLKLEIRAAAIKEREIEMDRFTVDEKIQHINHILQQKESFEFTSLFDDDFSKSEIITTFQALLELIKMERIKVVQEEIFGEIYIYKVKHVLITQED